MAMTEMLFPGFLRKALTVSYDDGVQQDRRLIDILKANGIKGTFNLNAERFNDEERAFPEGTVHRPMALREALEVYPDSGMEIACHGYTHPFMDKLSEACAAYETVKCRERLEAIFGRIVRGMAYPMGTTDDKTVEALRAAGIAYCRTTVATGKFSIPTDWLRMPATCHHFDSRIDALADKFVGPNNEYYPWLFYIWGHAYEFDFDNTWDKIEALYKKLGNLPDVWYATNIEIYEYVTAYRSLVFNITGTTVYNPTSVTVYFGCNGRNFTVKPGETLTYA